MADFSLFLAMLGALLLYIVPALLAIGHVIRNRQPRLRFVVFLCMPQGGPLLYCLWPRASRSRPYR